MLVLMRASASTTLTGWFPYVVSPDNIIPSMCYSTTLAMSPISAKVGFVWVNIDSKIYVEIKT